MKRCGSHSLRLLLCAAALAAGASVRAQTTAELLHQAERRRDEARAAHDRKAEAEALRHTAAAYELTGETRLALAALTQSLSLSSGRNDAAGEAEALTIQGRVLNDTGQPKAALRSLARALVLARSARLQAEEADVLSAQAEVMNGTSDAKAALELLHQALAIEQAIGDRKLEVVTTDDIGEAEWSLNDLANAKEHLDHALEMARALGDRRDEAVLLNDLGSVSRNAGKLQEAVEFYRAAVILQEALGTRVDEAVTLYAMGNALAALGRLKEALDSETRALKMNVEIHSLSGQALSLHAIGDLDLTLAQPHKALPILFRARLLDREVGDRQSAANASLAIASAYVTLGQSIRARGIYVSELPALKALDDKRLLASGLHNLGVTYQNTGQPEIALRYYRQAIPMEQAANDRLSEAFTRWRIASAESANPVRDYLDAMYIASQAANPFLQGQIETSLMRYFASTNEVTTAIFFGKEAVNHYQQVRENMRGMNRVLQDSFVQSRSDSYRELAKLLVAEGRFIEAEIIIGMLKQEEFAQFTRGDPDPDQPERPAPYSPSEAQARSITADEVELVGLNALPKRTPEQNTRVEELNAKLKQADVDFQQGLAKLLAREEVKVDVDDRTFGMQNAIAKLSEKSPDTIGVYTLALKDEIDLIVVTGGLKVTPHVVPISRADLFARVSEFRARLLDPCSNPKPAAQAMYKLLIEPIRADLEGAGAKTIVWELDGYLRSIPMGALYDGSKYLAESYDNVIFPMGNQVGLGDQDNVAAWRALGLGTSDYPGAPLPSVVTELEGIIHDTEKPSSKGPLPGRILLNADFTPQNMKLQLKDGYPIVHIASHFVLTPGSNDSFLLLGADDAGRPGSSRVSYADLRQRRTYDFSKVQLLALSACETGLTSEDGSGKEIDALGMLTVNGGANSVLATLWEVNDDSTGQLMTDFYHSWVSVAGQTKSKALAQSQVSMLKANRPYPDEQRCKASFGHPYYWSPFILLGNWL